MKQFETGKVYKVNGPGYIRILRRTDHYITFTGDYTGRRKIAAHDWFKLGEMISVPGPVKGFNYLVFAGHDAEGETT